MIALAAIAAVMLASAALAFTRRNLIHSALLLVLTWSGVAAFYLWADAQFVAFAQLLVYVGAVSMVVLFAVLLTRRSLAESVDHPVTLRRGALALLAGAAVLITLAYAVLNTRLAPASAAAPSVTVKQIGQQLMGEHAASLLIVGVVLTVALIGAAVIAVTDETEDPS